MFSVKQKQKYWTRTWTLVLANMISTRLSVIVLTGLTGLMQILNYSHRKQWEKKYKCVCYWPHSSLPSNLPTGVLIKLLVKWYCHHSLTLAFSQVQLLFYFFQKTLKRTNAEYLSLCFPCNHSRWWFILLSCKKLNKSIIWKVHVT